MQVTKGHENVFVDCGFSPEEAENLRLRSDMMVALRSYIETQGLSAEAASELLKVPTRKVNDVVKGRIERLTAGALLEMITHAGLKVEIRIGSRARRPDRAA